jgi:hypothetical protein
MLPCAENKKVNFFSFFPLFLQNNIYTFVNKILPFYIFKILKFMLMKFEGYVLFYHQR